MTTLFCKDCGTEITAECVQLQVALIGRFEAWCTPCFEIYLNDHLGYAEGSVAVWIDQPEHAGRIDETPVGDDHGKAAIWSAKGTVYVASPTRGNSYKRRKREARARREGLISTAADEVAYARHVPWEAL